MASRAHVRKTDNSRLSRSVLTNRRIQSSRYRVPEEEAVAPAPAPAPAPVSEKKWSSKKKTKK